MVNRVQKYETLLKPPVHGSTAQLLSDTITFEDGMLTCTGNLFTLDGWTLTPITPLKSGVIIQGWGHGADGMAFETDGYGGGGGAFCRVRFDENMDRPLIIESEVGRLSLILEPFYIWSVCNANNQFGGEDNPFITHSKSTILISSHGGNGGVGNPPHYGGGGGSSGGLLPGNDGQDATGTSAGAGGMSSGPLSFSGGDGGTFLVVAENGQGYGAGGGGGAVGKESGFGIPGAIIIQGYKNAS